MEQTVASSDPDPKALSCYGVLLRPNGQGLVPDAPEACETRSTALCRTAPGERHHHPVLGVVLYPAGAAARARLDSDLGQRVVAHQQGRALLDSRAQSDRQVGRFGSPAAGESVAGQESLAQSHRTEMGPRQARHCRTRASPPVDELADRICAYFSCSHEPHLSIPDKVA